ncbi:RNI-like protein [Panus rudis PR-1116 ss-1]|nr:RNI-like protein [Panus rudis PR-1116 ss-1]
MAAVPEVGKRIIHAGYIGTIRYIGPVDGTQGSWLGVEWDDSSRGKHDGVKDGKRYFTCIVPNSGSFIRPTAQLCFGVSFLTALRDKYVEQPRNAASVEKVVLGSSNGAIEVEAVGLDKIRAKLSRLENLREASLDNTGVALADPVGRIKQTCPGIKGLDLSKNLMPSWDVVAMICSELVRLERLALNQNRLTLPSIDDAQFAEAFLHVKEIQLNDTLTSWRDVQSIIRAMPALEILELGYNRLRSLELPNSDLNGAIEDNHTLHTINFDSNEIDNWTSICKALSSFRKLDRLLLSSNKLEEIDPLDDVAQSPIRHLKHLALSFNKLTEWIHIDRLAVWCPQLESLKLTGNPVSEDSDLNKNVRQLVIARLPSLQTLDATPITTRERTDSEIYYLSYITKHWPPDEELRAREHPRWKELCEKYGRPDDQSTLQSKQGTLGNRLLNITISRYPGPSSSPSLARSREVANTNNGESYTAQQHRQRRFGSNSSTTSSSHIDLSSDSGRISTKQSEQDNSANVGGKNQKQEQNQNPPASPIPIPLKVLPTMNMRTFRMKVAKSFKIPKAQQPSMKIYLTMPDGSLRELAAEEDTHDLSWLGIEDGSELVLEV